MTRSKNNAWGWIAAALSLAACRPFSSPAPTPEPSPVDWNGWRGHTQVGRTGEIALPIEWGSPAWTQELPGGGTPVVVAGRLYAMTYPSVGGDVVERLVCLDARTGEPLWSHDFHDFLSDIIYERYAIGSPAVDPSTGRIHVMTSPGIAAAFREDGTLLWERSLMEEMGRLTFPNGRTGSPVVLEDLVIHRGITSHWGDQAPGRDRFFALDGETGELVWTSTPGTGPGDSSFSTPFVAWHSGRPVLYAGTGCGHVVALDGRTGTPLWRFRTGRGGVNASVVVAGDRLVTIHGQENLDEARLGRMIAVGLPHQVPTPKPGHVHELEPSAEIWRNPLSMFTSSPALGKDRIYQCTLGGELAAVSLETGNIEWVRRLGAAQLHASPLLADGILFVPMWEGEFHILDVSGNEPKGLEVIEVEGTCLGAPAAWNGFIYLHTTERLYAFRGNRPEGAAPETPPIDDRSYGDVASGKHRVVPAEAAFRPGDFLNMRVQVLSPDGSVRSERALDPQRDHLTAGPGALVVESGGMRAANDAAPWSGTATIGPPDSPASLSIRILPDTGWSEDFEDLAAGGPPPAYWVGARGKWTVEEVDANQVLAKSLDNILFQRNTSFIGHVAMRDYGLTARVRSEGDRWSLSDVGLVNQRYLVALRGNGQTLEVSSNQDRLKVSVPFAWSRDRWYRLRTEVEAGEDGRGVIRGRAWPDGSNEPTNWTIEVPVDRLHPHGAPGVFGFSLQGRNRVFVDDVQLTTGPASP